jgi:3-oxoacyl-(acyl-carrier-protein) synthase
MHANSNVYCQNKIDYINTHGTSTPVGDITELNAVKNTFVMIFQKLVQQNLYQDIHWVLLQFMKQYIV